MGRVGGAKNAEPAGRVKSYKRPMRTRGFQVVSLVLLSSLALADYPLELTPSVLFSDL